MRRDDQPAYAHVTISDLADGKHGAWVWANCGLGCGNYAAIPLDVCVRRFGGEKSAAFLLARLRCTKCGGHPGTFTTPSYVSRERGWATLPIERVPSALLPETPPQRFSRSCAENSLR
jgi:hypothetical protein